MQRLASRRAFAAAAACRRMATAAPAGGEQDLAVKVFVDQQRKFRALVEGSKNLSLPQAVDAAAVKKFQADYEALRKKVGILSTEERLARLLKAMRETTPDVRTYLREAALLRKGACIPDSQGVDEAMMAALDAQEKAQGGKALLFADAKGMEAFRKSVAALQAKVGADKADQAQLDAAALEEDYTQMVEQLVGARNAAVVDAKQRDAVFLANATAAH